MNLPATPPTERLELLVAADLGELWLAVLQGGRPCEIQLQPATRRQWLGAIFKARVTGSAAAVGAAFIDIGLGRDAFLIGEDGEASAAAPRRGEELLVQIVREADGAKGPRATRKITLAGWGLVLALDGSGSGVSRRIESEPERLRLRQLVDELAPSGRSLIARTSAHGMGREELALERDQLVERWKVIEQRAAQLRAPALVHIDEDPALGFVRDHLALAPARVLVAGPDSETRAAALATTSGGLLAIEPLIGPLPAVEAFGLDRVVERALARTVNLASGGRLVIETTEALTAIDVNSGRDFSAPDLEETALRTNLEAAEVVAEQIMLRDLAGMIVIDFIDMLQAEHRAEVDQRLAQALSRDRAKLRQLPLNEFCLAHVTRQRRRPALARHLLIPCDRCAEGHRVRPEEQARRLLRQLRVFARPRLHERFQLRAPAGVLASAQELLEQHAAECGLPDPQRVEFVEGQAGVGLRAAR